MYFNIRKKLYIHKSFLLLPILLLAGNTAERYICMFFFALLHEGAHYMAAKALCGCGGRLFVTPYGFEIRLHSAAAAREALVLAAGPALSLLLACVFRVLHFELLYKTNGLLFLINIVPALPLDGGKLLRLLLWKSVGAFYGNRYIKTVSLIMCAVFLLFSIILHSLWLSFVALLIFFSLRRLKSTPFYKKRGTNVPVKFFYTQKSTSLSELMRLFSPYYYICVYVGDSQIAKTEAQIIEAAKNFGCSACASLI